MCLFGIYLHILSLFNLVMKIEHLLGIIMKHFCTHVSFYKIITSILRVFSFLITSLKVSCVTFFLQRKVEYMALSPSFFVSMSLPVLEIIVSMSRIKLPRCSLFASSVLQNMGLLVEFLLLAAEL